MLTLFWCEAPQSERITKGSSEHNVFWRVIVLFMWSERFKIFRLRTEWMNSITCDKHQTAAYDKKHTTYEILMKSSIHHHNHYRNPFSGFRQFSWVWRPREDPRRAHLQREDRQEVHGERHGDRHLCHKHQTMINHISNNPDISWIMIHDGQCSRIGWWEPSLRCGQGRAGQGSRLPSTESSSLWSPWSPWSFWYHYDYEHHQHHQAQERAAMRDAIRATSSGPSSAARLSLVIIGMVIMGYHRLSSFWSSLWSSVIIGYHLWSSVITFMITIFTIVITNTIMTNITVITISSQIM